MPLILTQIHVTAKIVLTAQYFKSGWNVLLFDGNLFSRLQLIAEDDAPIGAVPELLGHLILIHLDVFWSLLILRLSWNNVLYAVGSLCSAITAQRKVWKFYKTWSQVFKTRVLADETKEQLTQGDAVPGRWGAGQLQDFPGLPNFKAGEALFTTYCTIWWDDVELIWSDLHVDGGIM